MNVVGTLEECSKAASCCTDYGLDWEVKFINGLILWEFETRESIAKEY